MLYQSTATCINGVDAVRLHGDVRGRRPLQTDAGVVEGSTAHVLGRTRRMGDRRKELHGRPGRARAVYGDALVDSWGQNVFLKQLRTEHFFRGVFVILAKFQVSSFAIKHAYSDVFAGY